MTEVKEEFKQIWLEELEFENGNVKLETENEEIEYSNIGRVVFEVYDRNGCKIFLFLRNGTAGIWGLYKVITETRENGDKWLILEKL